MQRTLLFRADASPEIGAGHVMRCQAIAEEMMVRGWRCAFASRHLPASLRQRLDDQGCRVIRLRGGLTEREQIAAETTSPFDWLILDHYNLNAHWFEGMQGLGQHWMAIDDLGDRQLGAEVVLDSGLTATSDRYCGRVPQGAKLLLGPRYVPLRQEFRLLRDRAAGRSWAGVQRVLISFGGGDPQGMTAKTITAVRQALPQAHLDVVIGPVCDWEETKGENVQVHRRLTRMAPLLLEADLAIGAAGSSAWERCAMGLPSIVMALSRNQEPIAQALHNQGAVWNLGVVGDDLGRQMTAAVRELAGDEQRRKSMGQAGMHLVDGRGAARIGHHLEGVRLRRATLADEETLFRWANDPETRANSFHSAAIPFDEHQRWLRERLADPATVLWIGENGSGALGVVRFDRAEGSTEVSITVAPAHRGGVGRLLLDAAIRAFDRDFPRCVLLAKTKPGNVASQHLFRGCGFHKVQDGEDSVVFERAGRP